MTLNEYICILLLRENWPFYEPILHVSREYIRELLDNVREIRNALAHFRGDLTSDQRDKLKFGVEWLTRCQEDYQARKNEQEKLRLFELANQPKPDYELSEIQPERLVLTEDSIPGGIQYSVLETTQASSRYSPLADYLQSIPGHTDNVFMTFNQIEDLIKFDLPDSARKYRAWWANDAEGHNHANMWKNAGWRISYIKLSDGVVAFSRIQERKRAYIAFFSKLLFYLSQRSEIPTPYVTPDGASWMVINTIPRTEQACGLFTYSFSRDGHFRIELYLDLGDQNQTKAAYDQLLDQKLQIEGKVGPIEWEKIDNYKASRLAMSHEGQIMQDLNDSILLEWAVGTMVKFYQALLEPSEQAILEVKRNV